MSLEMFWNGAVLSPYLSGSRYEQTVKAMGIGEYMVPDATVMEVGVGLGYVTRELKRQGMRVSALDISGLALSFVEDYCEDTYTLNELNYIPKSYFDCIFMANVVQHVPTSTLLPELMTLIQALKPSGLLSLEFVSSDPFGPEDQWKPNWEYTDGLPNFCRSTKRMGEIVNVVGGIPTIYSSQECDIGDVKGCHVMHVRRNF